MSDIKNIKLAVAFVIEAGNVADKIVHTEGTPQKFSQLISLSDEVFALAGLKISEIAAEYKDLDQAEKDQIIAFINEKFEIKSDMLETVIEKSCAIAIKAEGIIVEIVELVKSAKVQAA